MKLHDVGGYFECQFRERIWPHQEFGFFIRTFDHGAVERWYGVRLWGIRLAIKVF